MSNLDSKVILITGGASGFGAAFLRSWAPQKAVVIIGDINETAGTALIQQTRVSSGNPNLHFLKLNVTDWKSQLAFFKEATTLSPHGGIDAVIANAGIADAEEAEIFENPPNYSTMNDTPIPSLRTLDINLNGVMYTTHLAISYLSRNPSSTAASPSTSTGPRDRHLLLISSMAGLSALPTQSIYATSKHGVVGLFRSLRISVPLAHGIRINMLNPYFVDTPILGPAGLLVMAGGGLAEIQSVVEAATRCVTDQSVMGRGLIIGPKATMEEAKAAGFEVGDWEKGKEQAVWDVYADDFEQSDVFTRRVIAVTNLRTGRRGLMGILSDIGWAFTPTHLRKLLGS